MSHMPYEAWLAVYDDLGPGERERVDEHLRGCPQCTARLADCRAIPQALQALPTLSPDPQRRQAFYDAVARARAQDRRGGTWARLSQRVLALGNAAGWVAVAAVAVVLVVGLVAAGRPLVEKAWPATGPTVTSPPVVLPATAEPSSTPTGAAEAPAEIAEPTPTPGTDLQTFTFPEFGVSLQAPAGWTPVEGYDARYGGPDGFFSLSACSGPASIDELAAQDAGHRLQPYGSNPTIESLTIQGQEARLILPSADEDASMEQLASLLVRYPEPVTIREETYAYLQLDADQGHIRGLSATLEFLTAVDAGPVEGWTGTLVKNCAMAQFDDYFRRNDGLRYGVAGATAEVEAEIERLRCQAATEVQVWGQLETDTIDTDGRCITVTRLRVLSIPPAPTPWPGPSEESVDGWDGIIVPCGEGDAERSFVRTDGTRAAIDSVQADALEALRLAECEGFPVRVWGALHREAGGLRIVAERVEGQRPASGSASPGLATQPVVTGGEIDVDSWSPDGEWLAFWQAQEDAIPSSMGPLMTLALYHVPTGEVCRYPETEMTRGDRYYVSTAWTADGQFAIWNGEAGRLVVPCQGSFRPAGEGVSAPAEKGVALSPGEGGRISTVYAWGVALSPGGTYRASTVYVWGEDAPIEVGCTFTDVATGQTVQVVQYHDSGGDSPLLPAGPGGEWVTDRLFLINYTLDRGPLLVDLEQGRVVEVGPELFGIEWKQPPDEGYRAEAQATADGRYHIALSAPRVRLYHSETGQIEELDLPNTWSPAFSPDGQWLLMAAHPQRPGAVAPPDALWARPVDPPGSRAQFVAEGRTWPPLWMPDWSRLAIVGMGDVAGQPNSISLYGFPDGRLLGSWDMGEYLVYDGDWSDDGRRLAVVGSISATGQYGLFVVEP